MPDNTIRCVLARGAPWLTQCSGRDATRYAAPRRPRGFHTDGHPNVTCNASGRNGPRSCAPSTAGRALDWIYSGASGGRTRSDWSLTSCLEASPTRRRGRKLARDLRQNPATNTVPRGARRAGGCFQEYADQGMRHRPCRYLAQYLTTYLDAYCAHRLPQYRRYCQASTRPTYFATHRECSTAHDVVRGIAPDCCVTCVPHSARYAVCKLSRHGRLDADRCSDHRLRTSCAHSALPGKSRHTDAYSGPALRSHTGADQATRNARHSMAYLEYGAQAHPGHDAVSRVSRSPARSSHYC